MAAVEAMMLGMLPPAGDRIHISSRGQNGDAAWEHWLPYRPSFYASGTAALAAALTAIVRRAGRPRPEVILPGYGCPALVSAVLYAGGVPVYADLESERPWLSLPALRRLLGPDTVAVVAVSMLGIPERLAQLRELIGGRDIALVNDSAQALPAAVAREADMLVLSFGRGKPVSLLGGGAVLVRDAALAAALPEPVAAAGSLWRLRAKAAAYNLLRRPGFYWLPHVLPLGLGETRYEPLTELGAMTRPAVHALPAAMAAYGVHRGPAQERLRALLRELGDGVVLDLSRACRLGRGTRLLRYPLLARDAATRDALTRQMPGLGASKMYGAPLPRVRGVPVAADGPLPAAQDFANRLFTLPVHDLVAPRHLAAMAAVLRRHQVRTRERNESVTRSWGAAELHEGRADN